MLSNSDDFEIQQNESKPKYMTNTNIVKEVEKEGKNKSTGNNLSCGKERHCGCCNKVKKCSNCDFKSSSLKLLKRHQIKHVLKMCNECDYQTETQANIYDHKKRKHNPLSNSVQCDQCEFKSNSTDPQALNRHKRRHIFTICRHCGHEANSKRDMFIHKRNTHKNDLIYSCEHCQYKSNKYGNIKKHTETVHEGFRIDCGHCEKKFIQHSDLNRHLETSHAVQIEKKMICKDCDFTTLYRQIMTRHNKTDHIGQSITSKVFCDQCNYSCRFKQTFKKHKERIHGILKSKEE